MPSKNPPTPLQRELGTLIRAAMLERGVGYTKLQHITGYSRGVLQKCTDPRQQRRYVSTERMMSILNALGYDIEIGVRERELTNEERRYFHGAGARLSKYRPTTTARAATEPFFTVLALRKRGTAA